MIAPDQRLPISSIASCRWGQHSPGGTWVATAVRRSPAIGSGHRPELARALARGIERDVAGDIAHGDERLEREDRDRLDQLLLGPAGLPGRLVDGDRDLALV